MPAAISFHAVLEPGGPSFMPTQVVAVPEAVCTALGRSTKRVVCTIGRRSGRLGLLPATGGGRYLLRKDLCQQLGLAIGQGLTLGRVLKNVHEVKSVAGLFQDER